jgi:hypothetical protein
MMHLPLQDCSFLFLLAELFGMAGLQLCNL